MKHIVYLDQDILNSYIAQIDNGIVTRYIEESGEDVDTSTGHSKHGKNAEKGFEINIPIVKLSGKTISQENDENFLIERTEYGKNLIEKVFHDNLLNNLIDYLIKEKKIKTDINNINIGDYVEIKYDFDIFDLNYIKEITSKETMKKIFSFADNKTPSNNKETNYNKQIAYLDNIVKILETILPFDKAIIGDKLMCPLNEKYMRESLHEVKFKYSEKITVFGKVTKKLNEINEIKYIKGFSDIISGVNKVIDELFLNPNMFIIAPIALFFE